MCRTLADGCIAAEELAVLICFNSSTDGWELVGSWWVVLLELVLSHFDGAYVLCQQDVLLALR